MRIFSEQGLSGMAQKEKVLEKTTSPLLTQMTSAHSTAHEHNSAQW
jgi:hypothetical protein